MAGKCRIYRDSILQYHIPLIYWASLEHLQYADQAANLKDFLLLGLQPNRVTISVVTEVEFLVHDS